MLGTFFFENFFTFSHRCRGISVQSLSQSRAHWFISSFGLFLDRERQRDVSLTTPGRFISTVRLEVLDLSSLFVEIFPVSDLLTCLVTVHLPIK